MSGTSSDTHDHLSVCAICLRHNNLKLPLIKCSKCSIVVERQCINALSLSNEITAMWVCPRCADDSNKFEKCKICDFSGGFMLPLKNTKDLTRTGLWLHPFCVSFHKEFYKNGKNNFFLFNDNESVKEPCGKLIKKANEKALCSLLRSLPACIYCHKQRGHKKKCPKCHRQMHAICAYKVNIRERKSEPLIDKGERYIPDFFICTECKKKNNNPETINERSKAIRKSTRIESRPKKPITNELMIICDNGKDNFAEPDADRKQKKHTVIASTGKTKSTFHPKAINILKAIIESILKVDELKVFKKDYSTLPIDISETEAKVIFILP